MAEINQTPYSQYQYKQHFDGQNVSSKGLSDVKKNNRLIGAVTNSVGEKQGKNSIVSSFLISLLASIGIVRGTNWLLQPKNITDKMTQYDTYTNSRLYKAGESIDKFGPLQWISKKLGSVKSAFAKIPLPNFIKEIVRKWKIGSVATWDRTGMWTKGKSAEAMNEFLDFLSKASLKKLKLGTNEKFVRETLKNLNAKKISPIDAFKKIAPIFKKMKANDLAAASEKTNFLSSLFGTSKNLNLSLSKAQTLLGESGGAVGKNMGKATTLFGEASGGGVLGGNFALLMNALFIAQNLNEARKAEDGEKLKTFMDEFFGTTLGSYLMQMYMGQKFNKFLGIAELGMNLNSKDMQAAIKQLGVENPQRVLDVVTVYNKFVTKNKVLNQTLAKLEKGNISIDRLFKILEKQNVEAGIKNKALAKILDCLNHGRIAQNGTQKVKGVITPERALKILKRYGINLKDATPETIKTATEKAFGASVTNLLKNNVKSPAQVNSMYNTLLNATKSNIKFADIFKKTEGKTFLGKLGKYIIQKPVELIAKFLATGRYTLTKPNAGIFSKIGATFKRWGGGIGRILFVMMVLTPPIAGLFTKFSHLVFGKPKKKILEEQKAKLEEQRKNIPQPNPNASEYVPFSNQNRNLIEMYKGKKFPKTSNTVPAQNVQPLTNESNEVTNSYDSAKYVPNQMLAQESFVDVNLTDDLIARRDKAIRRADAAERNYRELLGKI